MADASIYNALSAPRRSAFDYAREFEDQALQRESAQQARQMNMLQLQSAQEAAQDRARARMEGEGVRTALSGLGATSTPEPQIAALRGLGTQAGRAQADALEKGWLERRKTSAAIDKDSQDVLDKRLSMYREAFGRARGPQDVARIYQAQFSDPVVAPHVQRLFGSIEQAMSDVPTDPQAFAQWLPQEVMGYDKYRESLRSQANDAAQNANRALVYDQASGQFVPNRQLQAFELAKAKAGASSVSVNAGQKGFDNELKLRGDFRGEPVYKAHQEMQSAYGQIKQAIGQATPAGDLAAATKIMKLLDPGSVVRESELGMAMAATGLLDRVQNYASNIVNGTKLTPKQRQEFQALADALYGESVAAYNAKHDEYTKLGGEYGLNAGRAVGPKAAGPTVQKPAGNPGAAPQVLRFDADGNMVK